MGNGSVFVDIIIRISLFACFCIFVTKPNCFCILHFGLYKCFLTLYCITHKHLARGELDSRHLTETATRKTLAGEGHEAENPSVSLPL